MQSDYVVPPVSSYRVRRTVGFVDLSGFTHYANNGGDDAAVPGQRRRARGDNVR